MKKKILLKLFEWIAFFEGLSYIILLFIAMPMKYMLNQEILVKILGMPHGILFLLYIAFTIIIRRHMQWKIYDTIIIMTASIIPFGTFYIQKKYLAKN